MSKAPDFEKAARKTRAAKRRGTELEEVTADPNTLPWRYLRDPNHPLYVDDESLAELGGLDKQILRACYAKTIIWRNGQTGDVETDVIVRSQDAARRTGNFNSITYHISRSSEGREIINFLGVLNFRSVALDAILRIGTSEEAAAKTQAEMLKLAEAAEKEKKSIVKKAVKKIDG
jgi:hypothetical protein